MKSFNSIIAVLVLGVIVYLVGSIAMRSFWYSPTLNLDAQPNFSIAPGSSVNQVVGQLVDEGVLGKRQLVKLALRYFEPDLVLKAGEYRLPHSISRAQLFELLASGVSVQYSVTLVEGLSVIEAYAALAQQQASNSAAKVSTAEPDWAQRLRAILSNEARSLMAGQDSLEGWFFPDTYYFAKGDTPLDIFRRAHQKMLAVLNDEWTRRQADLPYNNVYEALIMASLVEKETGAVEEREAIAGVFVRRLNKGMRLQTDPSVIYGLGSDFQGNLKRSHLKRDTPYNTYTRHGLPPTPIALPGRGAIHAALHPDSGDALYFVAKGDGRHHFSATFKEHQRAVRQYQILNRRSDYRSAPKTGAG